MSKKKFAVLGSTNGSSLVPVIEAWKNGELASEPVLVLSNRKDAGILEKASIAGIPRVYLPLQGRSRSDYDRHVVDVLQDHNVDFVLLIGYMRILSRAFVEAYRAKIVNIHPSLLPKHGGLMDLSVHESVLNSGDCITGCTLHIVDEAVDAGRVLIQRTCEVEKGDTPQDLKGRVQQLEGAAFLELLEDPCRYLDFSH